MGYIEYYAIPLALSVTYLYYAVRYIKGKSSLWIPGLILLFILLFHLLGVILLPSLLYLIVLRNKNGIILKRFFTYEYPKTLVSLILIGIVGVLFFRPGPLNTLLINPFEFFTYHNYAPYVIYHSIEIINLLIFGSAAGLFLIIMFRRNLIENIKNDPLLNFIVINAFFGLLLIIFFYPSLSLAADWDIMTISLLLFNLLGVFLLMYGETKVINKAVYGLLISQAVVYFVIWFSTNSIAEAAESRFGNINNFSVPEGNPHLPAYIDIKVFLYYYYIENDYEKCLEIGEAVLNSEWNHSSSWEFANFFHYMGYNEIAKRFTLKYISVMEEKIKQGS